MLNSLLLAEIQNDFWAGAIPIIQTVLFFIAIVCALTIIVTVLMQSNNNSEDMDIISGSQESYYAQNKGSSRDGKLKIITIVMSSIAAVCVILFFITELFIRTA